MADSREVGTLVTDRTEDRMGKVYPEELKKKAVELYRLDEQTTYAEVGRDWMFRARRSATGCGRPTVMRADCRTAV